MAREAGESVTISDDESEVIVGTTKKEVLETFCKIPGIGLSKAELLYSAGYTSIEKLQAASVEELSKINGISPMLARSIINGLKKTDAKGEIIKKEEHELHEVTIETPKTNGCRNEIIDKYVELFSISRDKAESIYFSGYTNFKLLKEANVEDLQKIYGIEKENALQIVEKMKNISIKDEGKNEIEVVQQEEPPTVIGSILHKSKSIWQSFFGEKEDRNDEKNRQTKKEDMGKGLDKVSIGSDNKLERSANKDVNVKKEEKKIGQTGVSKGVILEEADESVDDSTKK
ncbi:MAG: helix-hairpin-helix domain-containing protein [Thermoplasmata archaeon]